MNKADYLASKDVIPFLDWLSTRLDVSGSITHQYINRKTGAIWACDSLYDAYEKYKWPFSFNDLHGTKQKGFSFAENTVQLGYIRDCLQSAYTSSNEFDLAEASRMVFEWGGVTKGNVPWAKEQVQLKKLMAEYRSATTSLIPTMADDRLSGFTLRFNAGLTKVYSLLLKDFIIYDSRVGAALGWLVVQYCQDVKLAAVPPLLAFPWAKAKEGVNSVSRKNRDPSQGAYKISQIFSDQSHAMWNVRASWLISELAGKASKFNTLTEPMRAIESALFMIGYDLPKTDGVQEAGDRNARQSPLQPIGNVSVFPLQTQARHLRFRAKLDDNQVILQHAPRPNKPTRPEDTFTLDEICRVCDYLYSKFKLNAFPLANNVEHMGNNTERKGLGMAIRSLGVNVTKAQAASYLGPYLEEVGFFQSPHTRPTTWSLLSPPNCEDIKQAIHDYHHDV